MLLKVGTSYTFPIGTADIGITRELLENEFRQPYAELVRWMLNILLVGTGATDIDTKFAALMAAFSTNGLDFRLTMPNGTTDSQHTLLNSGSSTGTLIRRRPSVTTFQGAGGVTNIQCTAEIEAEYPVTGATALYRSAEETLTVGGGGPQFGFLLPLYGVPQKQLLRQRDSYRATQAGSAIGMYATPSIPAPIFAAHQLREPTVTLKSPRRRGAGYEDFGVSWQYEFESPTPLVGNPTVFS